MYEPTETDLAIHDLAENVILPAMDNGAACHLKWTCPQCGERVMASDMLELRIPITVEQLLAFPQGQLVIPPGLIHEEKSDGAPCGYLVDIFGYRFGVVLVYGL